MTLPYRIQKCFHAPTKIELNRGSEMVAESTNHVATFTPTFNVQYSIPNSHTRFLVFMNLGIALTAQGPPHQLTPSRDVDLRTLSRFHLARSYPSA